MAGELGMGVITEKEVRDRLALCKSEQVIQEVYSFGMMLVTECVERLHKIDAKAGTFAGFSGATLALIVSTFHSWSQNVGNFGIIAMFLSAVAVVVAGAFAISVMATRTFTGWFSTTEWLQEHCLTDVTKLKKYHILTMFGVIEEHEDVSAKKTKLLSLAQWAMAFAGVFLLVAFLDAAWFSLDRNTLCSLFNFARIARW